VRAGVPASRGVGQTGEARAWPDVDAVAPLLARAAQAEAGHVPPGLAFAGGEGALPYYGAVPWRHGLRPAEAGDAGRRAWVLAAMAERTADALRTKQRFGLQGSAGSVLARKPARSRRWRMAGDADCEGLLARLDEHWRGESSLARATGLSAAAVRRCLGAALRRGEVETPRGAYRDRLWRRAASRQ
jgi:hypothetical protein